MFREKKSIFERLTGIINNNHHNDDALFREEEKPEEKPREENWIEEENGEGQLAIDVYQTPTEIILQAMVAGVRPDDLEISINREMVTVRGKRERIRTVSKENYFFQELYWGSFARTVVLPEEVDSEESEATDQHGLLTIRLPKIDKKKTQKLKVRTG